ncbi:MAG: hypothetical protein QM780_07075 [Hyphomicrobium sp.]|uniref:hypothetical protein n=1 Tax=Hyphomicrobium sp. TaxID=82 RepID=UPI0039E3678A
MKLVTTAALVASGMLALTATAASAAIVCNADGDCWHVREHYKYEPGLNLRVYPDSWKWSKNDHYRWREHQGRGYWRGGVWVKL